MSRDSSSPKRNSSLLSRLKSTLTHATGNDHQHDEDKPTESGSEQGNDDDDDDDDEQEHALHFSGDGEAPIDAAPALAGPQLDATPSLPTPSQRPPPVPSAGLEKTLSTLSVCTLEEALAGPQELPDVPVSYRVPSPIQAMYDTYTGASSGWKSLGRMAEGIMHPFGPGSTSHAEAAAADKEKATKNDVGTHEAPNGTKAEQTANTNESTTMTTTPTNKTPSNPSSLKWWSSKLQLDGMASMIGLSIAADEPEPTTETHHPPAPISDADLMPKIGPRHRQARDFYSHLKGHRNVVLLGGYRGSVLRDAKTNHMLWIPLKVGASIRRPTLELGLTPAAEDESTDLVYADGVLSRIGRLVDMNGRLQSKCKRKGARVHSWGYDWRLSLGRASKELQAYLQKLYEESSEDPSQRQGAIVIAHSMGGLLALHALSQTENPRSFATLSFASTPFLGTPNILGPLAWGDATLFNATICSPRSTFSFRSTFYLMPRDETCFEERSDGAETAKGQAVQRKVDFLDLETWKWAGLSPVVKGTKLWQESQGRDGRQIRTEPSKADPPSEARQHAQEASEMSQVAHGPGGKPGQVPTSGVEMVHPTMSPQSAGMQGDPQPVEERSVPADKDESDCNNDKEVWTYLERTLSEVRQFDAEITSGFSEARYQAGDYPPITMVTSGRTPTTRGALAGFSEAENSGGEGQKWQSTVSASDYSRMVFGRGDGVVTLRSATAVPGPWKSCLVKDDPEEGRQAWITETSHRHVAILSDVDSMGRALWVAHRARERREALGR